MPNILRMAPCCQRAWPIKYKRSSSSRQLPLIVFSNRAMPSFSPGQLKMKLFDNFNKFPNMTIVFMTCLDLDLFFQYCQRKKTSQLG